MSNLYPMAHDPNLLQFVSTISSFSPIVRGQPRDDISVKLARIDVSTSGMTFSQPDTPPLWKGPRH